jgi:hypothetical protein
LVTPAVQIVGLVVLYVGSLLMAWAVRYAGKYLRPSTSGVHTDHKLRQGGPLGIVRHPYYVSYVLVLVGLGLALASPWPFLAALCVAVGIGPTAKAEEDQLDALFDQEYEQYQERVGRFFPKLFRRGHTRIATRTTTAGKIKGRAVRLSLKRVLLDGTLMNVLLTLIVYGSIYINPLFWVSDYPPDIQAAVGEVNLPIGQQLIAGVLFVCIVGGIPLYSNARLRRQHGGRLSFLTALVHSMLIFAYFAVWDLLVLDWLVFVTIRPDFIVIPGTEGLAGYSDYWFHFQVSFLGWVQWISIIGGGLVIAGLSMIRLGGRR